MSSSAIDSITDKGRRNEGVQRQFGQQEWVTPNHSGLSSTIGKIERSR